MYQLSKRSLARLKNVNPLLIAIAVDGIKNSPVDFGIPQHGGKRTADEQNLLFKQGVSKCDGFNKKSYHQSGNAFDIYGYVNGKATWNKKILTKIARHLQRVAHDKYNVDLDWGGDWRNFKDMPHFQIS
jgi:peptidoglycan L-alanyl-D-glutamate endopeptidase CwlK